jgi:hypothetical protein
MEDQLIQIKDQIVEEISEHDYVKLDDVISFSINDKVKTRCKVKNMVK